nr:coatomer subunit beta'-2 isoform X1 [Tanacetum cinerariifolium]GEZ12941.1 coatomer subunit beta'-2 isoform X1 [Tanacetum cinerariifolium]
MVITGPSDNVGVIILLLEYVNYVDRSHVNLIEVFKHMQLDDEEPHENGELEHEEEVSHEESPEEDAATSLQWIMILQKVLYSSTVVRLKKKSGQLELF